MSVHKYIEDSLASRVEWTMPFDVRSTAAGRIFDVATDPCNHSVHIQLHCTETHAVLPQVIITWLDGLRLTTPLPQNWAYRLS